MTHISILLVSIAFLGWLQLSSGQATVEEILFNDPDLSIFAGVYNRSIVNLCSDCNLTMFAPINSAFTEPTEQYKDVIERIRDNQGFILHRTDLVHFHVLQKVDEAVLAATLADAPSEGLLFTTMNGDLVVARVNGTTVLVNDVPVVQSDIVASNGVIHKLSGVMPPRFFDRGLFDLKDLFVGYGNITDLVLTFGQSVDNIFPGDFTILPPSDDAIRLYGESRFRDLLVAPFDERLDLMSKHVVRGTFPSILLDAGDSLRTLSFSSDFRWNVTKMGQDIFINDNAKIVIRDILSSNGIAHGIDMILGESPSPIPTDSPTASPTNSPVASPMAQPPTTSTTAPGVAPPATNQPTASPVDSTTNSPEPTVSPTIESSAKDQPTLSPVIITDSAACGGVVHSLTMIAVLASLLM